MNDDNTLCFRCGKLCGWSKVDETTAYDAHGRAFHFVERQLDCAYCGEVFGTKFFHVDKPLRELLTDPAFLASRSIVVGARPQPRPRWLRRVEPGSAE